MLALWPPEDLPLEWSLLDSSRKPGMPLRTVSSRSVEECRENLCLGGLVSWTLVLLLVLACRLEYTRPPFISSPDSGWIRNPEQNSFTQ